MLFILWEYIGLTKKSRQEYPIQINTNCRDGGNKIWVKNPKSLQWDIGFISYDRKGIIFYSNGWVFFPIVKKFPLFERSLNEFYDKKHGIPFEFCLGKAIALEIKIELALKRLVPDGFFVHRLHSSGVRSHGSDIIITRNKELKVDVFDNVKDSMCAIEVLGVRFYHGRFRFTHGQDKDFRKWMDELMGFDVLPVIAWVDSDDNIKFMVLNDETLVRVFYREKDGLLVQRKNYSPVFMADKYCFDANKLFSYLF